MHKGVGQYLQPGRLTSQCRSLMDFVILAMYGSLLPTQVLLISWAAKHRMIFDAKSFGITSVSSNVET
eukprot:4681745-Amphidinium_carterae.3